MDGAHCDTNPKRWHRSRVRGVQRNDSRLGSTRLGVRSCRRFSAAVMRPPPFPRTSRIRPFWGSRPAMRMNSSRNGPSSSTENVQMRM